MLSKLTYVAVLGGAEGRFLGSNNKSFLRRGDAPGHPDRSIYGPPAETSTTTVPPLMYGKNLPESKAEHRRFSGAGMKHKDGYLPVGCVNDGMLKFADKHGNPQNFEHPISVHRYDETLAKNDQEPMTPDVCFKFCRNFEHAMFFGIRNGDECYCSPYFEVVPGADEDCKIACPGDSSKFCGAQQKSSMFSMHASAVKQDFLAPEVIAESKSLVNHLEEQGRLAADVPMAILKAGQKLSTTQGSKGNMLATKHHETMEASHQDYVKKVDNLPNAFDKVRVANDAIMAYETEIAGATPVRAEELVKNVVSAMVPVGENEWPYEQLVHKVLYKTKSSTSDCFQDYLPVMGHTEDYTMESCKEYCGGLGHSIFGLADGGFCDCGDSTEAMAQGSMEEGCNVPCLAEPTQMCGHDGHTLVFGGGVAGGAAGGGSDNSDMLAMYESAKNGTSTMCDGAAIQPVLEVNTAADCATRCQETISPAKCVGFQFYAGLIEKGSVCMMFSDMQSYVHYSGESCPAGAMEATCYVQKTELLTVRRIEESAGTQAIEGCLNA